jgi:hypothetical protein
MTFKGTSGDGKAKAPRPKASVRVAQPKIIEDKPGVKARSGNNRTIWIVLIVLLVLGACCICSGFLAWTYGDAAVDFLRSMNIQ